MQVPEYKPKHDELITLRITKKGIERTIFILIILALLGTLYYQDSTCGHSVIEKKVVEETAVADDTTELEATATETTDDSSEEIVAIDTSTDAIEDTVDEADSAEETEEVEEVEEVVEEEEEETVVNLDCEPDPLMIDFNIDDAEIVKKTETWAKVMSITFNINNGGCTFYPLIKAYLWDDETQDALMNYQEGDDWVFGPGILGGQSEVFEMDTSISMSNLYSEKTLMLKLYDTRDDVDTYLKNAIYKFTVE